MSNSKNLLNETQIRQFMKLASLEPLSPGFIHGLTERGSKAGDEGSVAAGKEGDTDYSGEGEREGDESETHKGEDLEESHGRGRGEGPAGYGSPVDNGRAGARLREEAPGPEELEDFAADDLADDSLEGDEEAASDELEADADLGAGAGGERTVSVDDFLAALETALETVMDDEVEVSEEVPEEDELEADVELAPGDEDVDVDVEAGLEEGLSIKGLTSEGEEIELEEIVGFGSGREKAWRRIARGGTASKGRSMDKPAGHPDYKPDPSKGEKDYTPTEEEAAEARAAAKARGPTSSRDKFPNRGRSMPSGGMKIGGISEDQDELVERVTKRVAARILKSALAKKSK